MTKVNLPPAIQVKMLKAIISGETKWVSFSSLDSN